MTVLGVIRARCNPDRSPLMDFIEEPLHFDSATRIICLVAARFIALLAEA
jgi:hypothetical protein